MKRNPKRPINIENLNGSFNVSMDPTALDTPERIIEYCQKMGFIDGDVTDIESLITQNNELSLVRKDLGIYDAYIKKISENNYEIAINSKHHKNRQRFSMAHEYIHYQVHRSKIESMPEGEQILHRSEDRDPIEYQANEYAAQILMPTIAFKQKSLELDYSASKLSEAFQVSLQAVRIKAEKLGLPVHGG